MTVDEAIRACVDACESVRSAPSVVALHRARALHEACLKSLALVAVSGCSDERKVLARGVLAALRAHIPGADRTVVADATTAAKIAKRLLKDG